jgi:hypothetical protein
MVIIAVAKIFLWSKSSRYVKLLTMNSRRFRRFSLATLLVVISLIAVGLGTTRWQRQQTLAAYRQLHTDGVGLIMVVDNSHWLAQFGFGDFWLRTPRTAEIYVSRVSPDGFMIGPHTMSWDDSKKYLLALRDRLRGLGVEDIQIWTFDYEQSPRADVVMFANENDMVCGTMDSQAAIDERLESLGSQLP